MDEFRLIIQKRKRNLILIVLGIFVLNGVLFFLDTQYSLVSSQAAKGLGFLMGMFLGLTLLALFLIYEYTKALKNDQRLKKLYIDEHDERKALIKAKMAQAVLVSSIVLMLIAISVSIYFEPIVTITLICVLYAFILITLVFKIYYSRKY